MALSREKKAPFLQCYICREWTSLTSKAFETELCLPCYVDILEIRERRGAKTDPEVDVPIGEGPDKSVAPLYSQLEMFDSGMGGDGWQRLPE